MIMHNGHYELRSCLWELTLRCNLNCMHCGSVAGPAREKELSLPECFRVADEIVEQNCRELTFIGGEVFLYPGWDKIGRYLTEQEVTVNLMSNGFRLGNKEVEQILFAGLSNVGISIDGTEEVHNKIRGNSRSFDQIRSALRLLNEAGVSIGVVTSLLEMNYPVLEDLYQFLSENGVTLWQIQLVNPMGNMAGKSNLMLRPRHIPALTRFIREKNLDRIMLVVAADNVGYHDENEPYIRGNTNPFNYWTGCQAGLSSLFIDSVGNVKGCGALYDERFIEGNLRHESLEEIWQDPENFAYNRKFTPAQLTGHCHNCAIGITCKGGCRASNYFNTGSLYDNAYCRRGTQN